MRRPEIKTIEINTGQMSSVSLTVRIISLVILKNDPTVIPIG